MSLYSISNYSIKGEMIMIASLMKSWTIWMKIGVMLFGVFLLSWLGPDEIGLTDLLISLREDEETGNKLMLAVFC